MNLKEFTEKYGNKEVEEAKLKELLGIKDSKHWKPTKKPISMICKNNT